MRTAVLLRRPLLAAVLLAAVLLAAVLLAAVLLRRPLLAAVLLAAVLLRRPLLPGISMGLRPTGLGGLLWIPWIAGLPIRILLRTLLVRRSPRLWLVALVIAHVDLLPSAALVGQVVAWLFLFRQMLAVSALIRLPVDVLGGLQSVVGKRF